MTIRRIRLGVGHLNNRRPLFIELLEKLHDLLTLAGVQIARGLICQQQSWLVNHSARDADQLLLPALELAGIEIFFGNDLELVQCVSHHALPLRFRNVLVGQRQVNVFLNGQVVEQVVALEDHSDVALG